MNVWIRISSRMNIESDIDSSEATRLKVTAGLNLTVYVTKEHARKAQQQVGGIILEVNAICLADVESEFGKEVTLTADAHNQGSQSSSAYINVCCDGLSYNEDPEEGAAEFEPEAEAWLNQLEGETGFELHQ